MSELVKLGDMLVEFDSEVDGEAEVVDKGVDCEYVEEFARLRLRGDECDDPDDGDDVGEC